MTPVRGFRACRGDCALYEACVCADADTRHGDDAPALREAIRRLVTPSESEKNK